MEENLDLDKKRIKYVPTAAGYSSYSQFVNSTSTVKLISDTSSNNRSTRWPISN